VYTIALETTSTSGSLALLLDDTLVYEAALPRKTRVARSFAPELQEALRQAGWSPRQVDLFAICRGPGSFTGLRIAVTAAKVYAYATGCQVLGLNTLEVVAAQAAVHAGPRVWAVLDAQRGQLYVARFQFVGGQPAVEAKTQLLDVDPWLAQLRAGDSVTGPGLRDYQVRIPRGVRVVDPQWWPPQAATLGRLAWQQFTAGKRQDAWSLVPEYFRLSAAEEKRGREGE
jgi:tRNA threonylcarbamoyladenosine biosynthesis protein TsaB